MNEKMYLCPECEGLLESECKTCKGIGKVNAEAIAKFGNSLEEENRPKYLFNVVEESLSGLKENLDKEQVIKNITPLLSDYLRERDVEMIEAYMAEIIEKGYFEKEEEF